MDQIQILKDTREAYWQSKKEPVRFRCGISEAPSSCARYIWYAQRACAFEERDANALKFLSGGHRAEEPLLAELGDVIHIIPPPNGTQHRISIEETSGHLNGSCDGVADVLSEYTLIECKSVYDKTFKQIVKEGMSCRPVYIGQANTYIYGLNQAGLIKKYQFLHGESGSKKTVSLTNRLQKITRTLFIIENRQTSEVYYEFMPYDETMASQIINRFIIALRSSNPPARLSDNPAWFECKWCKYYEICHGEQIPLAHCRTCKHGVPAKNALWKCIKHNKVLTEEEQRAGCGDHLFIPSLIHATPVDVSEQYIEYDIHGKRFKNTTLSLKGPGNFTSQELQQKNSLTVVNDDFVNELRAEFPGMTIIGDI